MISKTLLPEFDHEMNTTRALLERVPEDRADFKPHPKSSELAKLALHVVNLLHWAAMAMSTTELDLGVPDGRPPRRFESTAKLLEEFDRNRQEARAAIEGASDEDMKVMWTLKNAGHAVFTLPRVAVLRSFVMNHLIHHRGQLSVYLRLNDVPLPSIYGPTADT